MLIKYFYLMLIRKVLRIGTGYHCSYTFLSFLRLKIRTSCTVLGNIVSLLVQGLSNGFTNAPGTARNIAPPTTAEYTTPMMPALTQFAPARVPRSCLYFPADLYTTFMLSQYFTALLFAEKPLHA